MVESDPEYWKKLTYSTLWGKHKREVLELKEKLEKKFPALKGAIKFGLGADTDEWLKIPPNQKGEGDLHLYKNYKEFCTVEITGSDKINVDESHPMWIRPDKLTSAKTNGAKGVNCWFYLVYKNRSVALNTQDIEAFSNNIITTTKPKGVPEKYIEIPYSKARNCNDMFHSIEQQLNQN